MDPSEIALHVHFMREALAMAELALNTNETPVGCVFVHQGTIIGRGMNATNRTYNGTRHAEFIALNDILSNSHSSSSKEEEGRRKWGLEVLKECILYVTVEPCIMCASLLRQMGIKKVFFGAGNEKFGGTGGVLRVHEGNGRRVRKSEDDGERDGNERQDGEREERWKEGDYEVSGGWLREEAILLLRRFYVQENERAPEPNKRKKVLKLEVEPLVRSVQKESGMG